jgi:2-polyprenyl-3-methyl-5-hydroxy-6-metoxy-1,4-benzoquinol methylase
VNNRYAAEIDLSNVHNTHSMLVLMVGEGKRVLELGASSGYMTRVLQQRGCRVTAIEYDPEAGAELALVADDTIIGDLNDLSLLGGISGRYDVVLAGDVFEHLIRPLDVLRAAVELLEPDGAVVLSVPNVAHADLRLSLLQGRFDYQETGVLDETHLRWFTHRTLVDMLTAAGLVVVELQRSIVRVFESEMSVPRDSVGTSVLSAVMRVPESETYQFVLTAMRDDGTTEMRDRVLAAAPLPEPDFAAIAASEGRLSGRRPTDRTMAGAVEFAQQEAVALQQQLHAEQERVAAAEAVSRTSGSDGQSLGTGLRNMVLRRRGRKEEGR